MLPPRPIRRLRLTVLPCLAMTSISKTRQEEISLSPLVLCPAAVLATQLLGSNRILTSMEAMGHRPTGPIQDYYTQHSTRVEEHTPPLDTLLELAIVAVSTLHQRRGITDVSIN